MNSLTQRGPYPWWCHLKKLASHIAMSLTSSVISLRSMLQSLFFVYKRGNIATIPLHGCLSLSVCVQDCWSDNHRHPYLEGLLMHNSILGMKSSCNATFSHCFPSEPLHKNNFSNLKLPAFYQNAERKLVVLWTTVSPTREDLAHKAKLATILLC